MAVSESLDHLLNNSNDCELVFSIKGLLKGHIGMLIAAPNIGKSHLALCIAMEHASSMTLMGLSQSSTPKKTLIVSSEDGRGVIRERILRKLEACPDKVKKELLSNLHFSVDLEPMVIPLESSNQEKISHKAYLDDLINKFAEFDLVIIDTVTESIGQCDEVKHDRLIKNTFQALAHHSAASILLVHHVNKDEIRGSQEITMASGAGLTSIMRLTKCLFTLREKNGLFIKFLKCNYFNADDVKELSVEVLDDLTVNKDVFDFLNNRETIAARTRRTKKRGVVQHAKLKKEPENLKLASRPTTVDKNVRSIRDVL